MKLPLISHFLRNNNKQTTNQQHQRQRCQKITHGKPHSTHTQKRARHFRNKYGWATAQKNNNKETNGLKPKLFHVFSSSFYFLSMRNFFLFCSQRDVQGSSNTHCWNNIHACTPKMASKKMTENSIIIGNSIYHAACMAIMADRNTLEHSSTERGIVLMLTSTDIHTCLLAQS